MNPVLALGITQIVGYGSLYSAFPIRVPGVAGTFGRPEAHLYAVFSAGLLVGGFAAPLARPASWRPEARGRPPALS